MGSAAVLFLPAALRRLLGDLGALFRRQLGSAALPTLQTAFPARFLRFGRNGPFLFAYRLLYDGKGQLVQVFAGIGFRAHDLSLANYGVHVHQPVTIPFPN